MDSPPIDFSRSGPLDVRRYGAIGDGVTDDTQAVQAAITEAIASKRRPTDWLPTASRCVYFPGGVYRVTKTFVVNAGQLVFRGEGRGSSTIEQATPNIPIFLWNLPDSGGWLHSIEFRDLFLRHASLPTPHTTNQWAIRFQCGSDGAGTDMCGAYQCLFDNMRIQNAYIGIGTYAPKGKYPIWGSIWRNVWFSDVQHTAIKIDSPVGQPHDLIEHCSVANNNPLVVADGPAIAAAGGLGLTITDLNVEDWQNTILVLAGSGSVRLAGLRSERHRFTGGYPVAYYLSGSNVIMDQVDFNSYQAQHTGIATIFRITDPGGMANFRCISTTKDKANSVPGNLTVLLSEEIGPNQVHGLRLDPDTLLTLPSAYGPTLWGHTSVDGMPPIVDALPVASEKYRGRSLMIPGWQGVRDRVYVCLKGKDGSYTWHDIYDR